MPDPTQAPEGFVPDGRITPSQDAPPEAFVPAPSADMFTDEADPPVPIVDRGFGPTGLEDALTDEEIEAAQAADDTQEPEEPGKETPATTETKPEKEELPTQDASEAGDDVKESPANVPYDRFKEMVDKAAQYEQSDRLLKQLLSNPEQAAAYFGAKAPVQAEPPAPKFKLDLDEPTPSKPADQMNETEQAQAWVRQEVYNILREPLGRVGGEISNLLSFKEQLTETLTRHAVDKEGNPLHPRWDELKGPMNEIKSKYVGMSDSEAYVLADKMIPQSIPVGDEMAMYNTPPRQPSRTPAAADVATVPAKPKRASPAALRAAKVASFGRASPGMSPVQQELLTSEQSVEKALDEIAALLP